MENFELLEHTYITELDSQAKRYIHRPTGAEILSISNTDSNKCFGIAFKTPPTNSTGIAHILEHTVLCGSKKYPLKDPFVQLLKGSLQTFLNAFTYPDKTCYPIASQNLQDFYNLTDVYLDAVFNPLLTEDFFKQEGWHYFLENASDPLTYKGVVYNEMKGVYSSAESLLMERTQQSLFPDTTYGLDSGGDPDHIPQLTYEEFKQFHADYYHPSNARIIFYGDDPEDKRLELIRPYLDAFQGMKETPVIEKQTPFTTAVHQTHSYATSANDSNAKSMFTTSWVLPSPLDNQTLYTFTLLDLILLGTNAAPLRKALLESGLGEDITGGGLETHLLQMCFSIGLKGVDKQDLAEAEQLIYTTLEDLVQEGIATEDIQAALNTFEFELRENNSGGFPRGLSYWLKALNGWIYGADPISLIAFEAPLQALKDNLTQPRYMENMIEHHFLNNHHRSTVVLHPDNQLASAKEEEEQAKLDAIKEQLNPEQIEALVHASQRLLQLQQEPDSPDAIATLPQLKRTDLAPKTDSIAMEVTPINESIELIEHPLFTNGIFYMDVGLDLRALSAEELPYATLLHSLFLELGTQKQSYTQLAQRIAQHTGGLYGSPFSALHHDRQGYQTRFFLRGKCMPHQIQHLFDIYEDILIYPLLDQPHRVKQLILEQKAELESALAPRGHVGVMTRLKAADHPAHWAEEQLGGIDSLLFLRTLSERLDSDWADIRSTLEAIHQKLLTTNSWIIHITADEKTLGAYRPCLEHFLQALPKRSTTCPQEWQGSSYPEKEALLIPSRVNYVGAQSNLIEQGYRLHGSSLVITRYLQTAWLWEKIRVQGGAYGGMCNFDHRSGCFVFASYRDPNLTTSIETYQKTGDYLMQVKLDEEELTRSIIGAIGQMDAYELPDAKAYSNLKRYLTGYDLGIRQQLRDEVLATTEGDFHAFGTLLDQAFRAPRIAVLCDEKSAKEHHIDTTLALL